MLVKSILLPAAGLGLGLLGTAQARFSSHSNTNLDTVDSSWRSTKNQDVFCDVLHATYQNYLGIVTPPAFGRDCTVGLGQSTGKGGHWDVRGWAKPENNYYRTVATSDQCSISLRAWNDIPSDRVIMFGTGDLKGIIKYIDVVYPDPSGNIAVVGNITCDNEPLAFAIVGRGPLTWKGHGA